MTNDRLMFDNFVRCESPLEALMQLMMAAASGVGRLEWCDAETSVALREQAATRKFGCVLVGSQVKLANQQARVDFLLVHGRHVLALECDGVKYHGSLEQTVRDRIRDTRAAQSRIKTKRFTGQAVIRDPRACLDESLQALGLPELSRAVKAPDQYRPLAMVWPHDRDALAQAARALSTRSGLRSAAGEAV